MATLNTIRTVSVRYQSEGAERFRSDADAAAASQANLAQATEQAATVSEQSARRQLSAASAYDRVRASVDANYRAQLAMERAARTVDRALQQGIIDGSAYERTLAQIQARFTTTTTAADRMAAAWRNLGAVGAANSRLLTPEGRLGSLSSNGSVQFRPGMGPAANQNVAGRSLRPDEITNLTYQGSDVLAQFGSGAPLGMIAMQQGPQIAQIFAGPSGASVKGAFAQATEAAMGLASRVGVIGGAFGALAVAAGAGIAAIISFRSGQAELEKILAGVGRTSGATVAQINALADAQARAGGMSRGAARDLASIYASTGRVDAGVLAGAVAATPDFAKLLGTDQKDAAGQLAGALGDVSRGAGDLAQRYGLLNDATAESVRRLDAQGDRLGAQRLLLASVRDSTRGLAEESRGWALVVETLANNWDRLGQALDRFATGGGVEARIADLRQVLESQSDSYLPSFLQRFSTRPALQAELDKLLERQRVGQQQAERAQAAQRSLEIGAIVRGLNPAEEALQRLEDSAQKIRSGLSSLPLDERRSAQNALDGMVRSSEILRDNMKAGGEQFAASLRQAQFDNRTVGFTGLGRDTARLEQEFSERRLTALSSGNAESQSAALRSLEEERRVRMETLARSNVLEQNQTGGAFSRMSAEVQAQLQAGAQRFGRIPVGVLAAIAQIESGGNLDVGYTRSLDENGKRGTAYGLGQITLSTGEDLARRTGLDRMNRGTMGEALAGVLDMKLDASGGDLTRAIMAYRGSRDPAINQAYAAKVMRDAGQFGDPSSTAQVRQQDEYNRALRDQQQQLANVTQNYGRNGAAMEAASLAAQRYNALLDAGVPPSQALAASIQDLATKTTNVAQQIKLTQFAADVGFEREQLGRTAIEQSAYAQARSRIGDTTSEGARYIIGETQANARLFESKAAVTDAMSGFVTDLRRGTDAASALSNAFGRLADRAINGLTDTLISNLFSSGTKGGGLLSGLFGGASGGGSGGWGGLPMTGGEWFANGGVMTSRGRLPLNAYAGGGIANSPQVAVFGEGRMPEAYVPLPDGRRIPVAMQGAANANAAPSVPNVNFIDQRPPGSPDVEPTVSRRSDGTIDVVVRTVENRMGQRAAGGQGPFKQAVGGAGYRAG